jgi:uncharacterized protein (TIGR00725 family)
MNAARLIVAVVGKGRDCPDLPKVAAWRAGKALAEAGAITLTGGLAGCMSAASLGASGAGGLVLAVLPHAEAPHAGFVGIALRSGLSPSSRNVVIATAADAMIACDGSHGTMQEIAVALDRGIPVVACATDRFAGAPFHLRRIEIEQLPAWVSRLAWLAPRYPSASA